MGVYGAEAYERRASVWGRSDFASSPALGSRPFIIVSRSLIVVSSWRGHGARGSVSEPNFKEECLRWLIML